MSLLDQYYRILELPAGASTADIKKAYRSLAKKYHPDVNPDAGSSEKFIEISEAYEILINQKEFTSSKLGDRFDIDDRHSYEFYVKMAREKARQAAKMKYERLKKEHEAFQRSGLHDIVLILKYAQNVLLIAATLFFIVFPVFLLITEKTGVMFFLWIPGIFLILYVRDKWKELFRLGSFFYSFRSLVSLLDEASEPAVEECKYCKGKKANSVAYRIEMLKIRDIKLDFIGPIWHQVKTKREYKKITIPRSKKAFIIHSVNSLVKLTSIITSMFLLPVDSWLWQFIGGMIAGGFISSIILLVSGTRSKVSYLFTRLMLIRILSWLLVLFLLYDFSNFPKIYATEWAGAGFVMWLFLQEFIVEPISRIFFRKKSLNKSFFRQPEPLSEIIQQGYQNCLDIPAWSNIFPFIKWIF